MNDELSKIIEQNKRLRESLARVAPVFAHSCQQATKAFENFSKACQRIKMPKSTQDKISFANPSIMWWCEPTHRWGIRSEDVRARIEELQE